MSLKAELALLKAGILTERIDAAKKLFIAEGGDLSKVAEFAAKYPEWQTAQEGRVVLRPGASALASELNERQRSPQALSRSACYRP